MDNPSPKDSLVNFISMKSLQLEIPIPWDERITALLQDKQFLAIVAMPLILGFLAFIYSRLVGPSVPELDVEITELEANDKIDVDKYTKAKDKKVRD